MEYLEGPSEAEEVAEIVAWFMKSKDDHLPELNGHYAGFYSRLRHEHLRRHEGVYIVTDNLLAALQPASPLWAKPGAHYERYLTEGGLADPDDRKGFMPIQICGPWSLTLKSHLDDFSEILLAGHWIDQLWEDAG
ncbi:hypothetical protein DPV78_001686 [Talaromyces pinophilus]|nr:hypothetical protein DPV78_001686 [Talaromyces pinophilus]